MKCLWFICDSDNPGNLLKLSVVASGETGLFWRPTDFWDMIFWVSLCLLTVCKVKACVFVCWKGTRAASKELHVNLTREISAGDFTFVICLLLHLLLPSMKAREVDVDRWTHQPFPKRGQAFASLHTLSRHESESYPFWQDTCAVLQFRPSLSWNLERKH